MTHNDNSCIASTQENNTATISQEKHWFQLDDFSKISFLYQRLILVMSYNFRNAGPELVLVIRPSEFHFPLLKQWYNVYHSLVDAHFFLHM